ncbi:hypothetical protein [Lysinibacillus sp.]|uniref:hypothetical protein n=1 Tax=Lysinibacillus sp. TaxID=1869345 RepID=UPI00289CF9BD|nr:hypothetical protein [Lysinibacillus sp.]
MVEVMGYFIIISILCVLALVISRFIKTRNKTSLPTELVNQEMFAEQEQVITELPKRPVADSHWHVKTFIRPRRKRV